MAGRRGGDSTMGVVLQMVQQNDEKHEKGHARLRDDWREHDTRLDKMENCLRKLELASTTMQDTQAAPIDIGKLVFAPKMVLAVVGLVISILGGTWFINQPIVSRLDRFEERQSSTKDVIDGLTKAMEMRRLEIQTLSNNLQQFQMQQQQLQREQQRTGR